MALVDAMIQEYEHEQASTRRVLERVPNGQWDFRPHEKSMTMGELASHIADNPVWARATMSQDVFKLDAAGYVSYKAENNADLLATFDKNLADALAAMAGATDEQMLATWRMEREGQTVMEMPRVAVLRTMIMSHTIHHRGQLAVYLRMTDVPLPSIYGPSADEQPA
jgi:uncharacterized damage-inducible protein DinB